VGIRPGDELAYMRGVRDYFDELLKIWFDKMMAETKALLERGVNVIFGSWYFASMSVGWGPAIYREVFLPMVKAHVALTHSYDAVYSYYDDGKCMGIADMVKVAGGDIFETIGPPPVGHVDLGELKRRIGDTVCLLGYGDMLYVIKRGTPEDVERMVKCAMETAGPRGFIFGTCDSIREETPRENVRTYFEAARKYGQLCAKRDAPCGWRGGGLLCSLPSTSLRFATQRQLRHGH